MSVLVEICACSVDDVVAAETGGAQRVELCSALALGGLTPSIGTLLECKRISTLPVMFMVRPRSGGFNYSQADFDAMERDIEMASESGADGFVFGFLNADGTIDRVRTKRLVDRVRGLPTVFHRAFDVTPDPIEALETIIDLGMTRILTSGQKPTSIEGSKLIREMIERASDRIEILPGGGIRPNNVAEIVQKTGCRMVHLSATTTKIDSSMKANPALRFNIANAPPEDSFGAVDPSIVAAIVSEARTQ